CSLLVRDPGHRNDLGGMHDCRVPPSLDAFVQENRVEHDTSGWIETEGDVGQAQRGLHIGEEPLDLADGLDSVDAIAPGFLLPGRDGEGETVEDDVALTQSPLLSDVLDRPLSYAHLAPRMALLSV